MRRATSNELLRLEDSVPELGPVATIEALRTRPLAAEWYELAGIDLGEVEDV